MKNVSLDGYAATAEYYDEFIPYRDRQDVEFYIKSAQKYGGPVLEIGCGTGRVLIPTAEAGFEITGLDASPYMLKVCKDKLEQKGEDVQARVNLVQGDMREFDLGKQFNLITIPFRPFQHLITVEEQVACLQTIHRHLSDEGRFILDIFNPSISFLASEYGEERINEPGFTMPDGRKVIRYDRTVERDLFNQINHIELIYYVTHPDGREERLVDAFPMRYLFRFEAEHLLARCGFEIEAVYADYDMTAYGEKYPGELIYVVRKLMGD